MPTKSVTDTNFETEVIKADKPVIVDFGLRVDDPTRDYVSGIIHAKNSDPVSKLDLVWKKFQMK